APRALFDVADDRNRTFHGYRLRFRHSGCDSPQVEPMNPFRLARIDQARSFLDLQQSHFFAAEVLLQWLTVRLKHGDTMPFVLDALADLSTLHLGRAVERERRLF